LDFFEDFEPLLDFFEDLDPFLHFFPFYFDDFLLFLSEFDFLQEFFFELLDTDLHFLGKHFGVLLLFLRLHFLFDLDL